MRFALVFLSLLAGCATTRAVSLDAPLVYYEAESFHGAESFSFDELKSLGRAWLTQEATPTTSEPAAKQVQPRSTANSVDEERSRRAAKATPASRSGAGKSAKAPPTSTTSGSVTKRAAEGVSPAKKTASPGATKVASVAKTASPGAAKKSTSARGAKKAPS